ncbi:MAG: zinc ABC transporter substrate-binding protein [Lachnospiraceae bacterium]|nr:zinc ABC transporter substrate-binding protein [Lachnospiraceae bacterium]
MRKGFGKRLLTVFLVLCLVFASGCTARDDSSKGEKLNIVTTIFPVCDWVKELCRDSEGGYTADITFLLDNGSDMHSYLPSASDIVKISESDVFIYVGGESDDWIDDTLKQTGRTDLVVIELMELLGDRAREEEDTGIVSGSHEHHHGEEEDHEHEDEHEHDEDEHEEEYDEHIWLSLINAEVCCASIAERLKEADPEHADLYDQNLENYLEKLSELDKRYAEAAENRSYEMILVADRFPLRYLVDDYDIEYVAAFDGCSADTQASFSLIVELTEEMNEHGLDHVIVLEGSSMRIAHTVIESSGRSDADILVFDSIQSVRKSDADSGTTYLKIMEKNLEVLRTALGS